MKNTIRIMIIMALGSMTIQGAEKPQEPTETSIREKETEISGGHWHLSVGTRWRTGMEVKARGRGETPGIRSDGFVDTTGTLIPYFSGTYRGVISTLPGDDRYFLRTTHADTFSGTDTDEDLSALGLTTALSYDLLSHETFSLGLRIGFAAYWNMRAETEVGGGTASSSYYPTDSFIGDEIPPSSSTIGEGYNVHLDDVVTQNVTGRPRRVHVKSDLYQIGIGPEASWHVLSRLDLYASAEFLANLVNTEVTGDGSSDETDCIPGVGARMGALFYVSENVGVFADAGYEYIDTQDVRSGTTRVETDFSALTVSAGVRLHF